MRSEVLNGWLETSGDLGSSSDGDLVGGPSMHMDIVQPGTLSAKLAIHSETSSLDIYPEWEVSDDESTWLRCTPPDNASSAKLVQFAVSADTDAIVTSLATSIADTDAIVTSFATSTSVVTKSGAGLNGVIGAAAISPPRGITIKTAANAGSYNVTDPIAVTGTDIDGNVLAGTGTLTQTDGNETIEIVGSDGSGFASVVSVAFPAQADTSGHFEVGVGSVVLTSTALTGVISGRSFTPFRTATVNTAAAVGAYSTSVDVTVDGLDSSGVAASDTVTVTNADGGESLETSQTYTEITRVVIPAMADVTGHFTVGLGDGIQTDDTLSLDANKAAYGYRFARASVRLSGSNGTSSDTYTISYSFRRNRS